MEHLKSILGACSTGLFLSEEEDLFCQPDASWHENALGNLWKFTCDPRYPKVVWGGAFQPAS